MQENELNKILRLAMQADLNGNYKSADEIDNFIKEAQNPQTWFRNQVKRLRGLGDEGARARRQVRDLQRGPNTVDKMRSQPNYDEALSQLDDGRNISGQNPMVLRSNATLTDRIINSLQPTFRQVQTKQKEFPELYKKWKAFYDTKIQEIKKNNNLSDDEISDWLDSHPQERENLVSPLESELVRMRNAHAALIEDAIDQVCSAYQIPRNMESLNKIKARIASDKQLRGMLYDNSFTTDSMIEQVLQSNTIPMKSYLNNMGPWKRSMSPAVTGLLFLGAGAAAGSGLKGAPKGKTPDKANTGGAALPAVGFLANELLADRKKAKLYDTPIEIIEKYIKRKKDVGAIKPGITTKGQLYDMAKIDLGEHIANNLIQYVVMEYGFTIPKNKTTEKEFVINFNKNNFNKKTP